MIFTTSATLFRSRQGKMLRFFLLLGCVPQIGHRQCDSKISAQVANNAGKSAIVEPVEVSL